jgi:type I restriction enzyme S subunit
LIHPRYEVKHGDLLMTRANTEELVGLACVAENPPPRLLLSDKTLRLHVDASAADPRFLQLALAQPILRQRVRALATGTSAGMKNIGQEQIRQLKVPGVPLQEQRRIVAAHAAFERRVAGLEGALGKLRQVERAVAEDLLFRYADEEGMLIADALAGIETGWSPACDSSPPAGDEWGVIKVSAVTSGHFDARESKRLPASLEPRRRIEVRQGDVLVARANGARSLVGAVCQVGPTRRRLMLSDKILRLVPDARKVDKAFLPVLLRSDGVRNQIGNVLSGGTGQNNISQADVRRLRVPRIALSNQTQIVAALAAYQQRFATIGAQITKLRTVQQAVVEDLLTGRSKANAA